SRTWRRATIIPNLIEKVRSVVWKPRDLEFVVSCMNGSVQAWRLQEVLGEVSAVLVWRLGYTVFKVSDAVITDAVGLSKINRKLLRQRGAIDLSSPFSLEDHDSLDMLELNPSEPSSLSDMEGWQLEDSDGSYVFISEEEDDQEDDEDEEEEEVDDD
ncbi:hypothetical protein BGZ47_003554, partial [Haplosporangium gracile]